MFDCLAYMHISKDQRRKLDPKTRPCIFLGYGDDEFGYRLWNLAEKKVIRSQDIVFMEEKTIVDWEIENKYRINPSSRCAAKSNANQSTDLILGKIENRLKNKGNRPKEELKLTRPNEEPKLTQPKKSKKNRLCRMEVKDTALERGDPPEDFLMKNAYC